LDPRGKVLFDQFRAARDPYSNASRGLRVAFRVSRTGEVADCVGGPHSSSRNSDSPSHSSWG
jgi:hypothetical protein